MSHTRHRVGYNSLAFTFIQSNKIASSLATKSVGLNLSNMTVRLERHLVNLARNSFLLLSFSFRAAVHSRPLLGSDWNTFVNVKANSCP